MIKYLLSWTLSSVLRSAFSIIFAAAFIISLDFSVKAGYSGKWCQKVLFFIRITCLLVKSLQIFPLQCNDNSRFYDFFLLPLVSSKRERSKVKKMMRFAIYQWGKCLKMNKYIQKAVCKINNRRSDFDWTALSKYII